MVLLRRSSCRRNLRRSQWRITATRSWPGLSRRIRIGRNIRSVQLPFRSRRNDLIQHFLAYGHADQDFFRGQTDLYDGLTIPGTVAAFYQQGAGGFVLAQRKPYFIDPRTPVFQAKFSPGKLRSSHWALAEIHGPAFRRKVGEGPLDPLSLGPEQRRE